MSIITAVLGFLNTILPLIFQWVGNILTYNAGKTAADDAARKAQDDAQAKADAAREAANIDAARNPGGLRDDDGFERAD